uniref:Uncharacterized protein n=1 Tax=Arundo donax TaxID=35708 RepID=A0A0A9D760_ARUDO
MRRRSGRREKQLLRRGRKQGTQLTRRRTLRRRSSIILKPLNLTTRIFPILQTVRLSTLRWESTMNALRIVIRLWRGEENFVLISR